LLQDKAFTFRDDTFITTVFTLSVNILYAQLQWRVYTISGFHNSSVLM